MLPLIQFWGMLICLRVHTIKKQNTHDLGKITKDSKKLQDAWASENVRAPVTEIHT